MAVGKERICNAFMKVGTRKPVEKVTVVDIITEADINRSSFYYHFHDAQDVLDYMYDLFADRYRTMFATFTQEGAARLTEQAPQARQCVEEVNKFIFERREMFLFLRNRASKQILYDRIVEAGMDAFRVFVLYFELEDGSLYTMPKHEYEDLLRYRAFRMLAFLDIWAESEFSWSPEYMTSLSHYLPFLNWSVSDLRGNFSDTFSRGTLSMKEALALGARLSTHLTC